MCTNVIEPAALKLSKSSWLLAGGNRAVTVCGDNVWRGLLRTLLGDTGCGGGLGLLSCRLRPYPGSPRLGSADPGLNYAAPLGLVWFGVVGRMGAVVEQGVLARVGGFVSRACDCLGLGEQHKVNGRDRSAGIATRCECVCERDVRQRGVSLRSTPRYRLGWLRHLVEFGSVARSKRWGWLRELKISFDGRPRTMDGREFEIVTQQHRGEEKLTQ